MSESDWLQISLWSLQQTENSLLAANKKPQNFLLLHKTPTVRGYTVTVATCIRPSVSFTFHYRHRYLSISALSFTRFILNQMSWGFFGLLCRFQRRVSDVTDISKYHFDFLHDLFFELLNSRVASCIWDIPMGVVVGTPCGIIPCLILCLKVNGFFWDLKKRNWALLFVLGSCYGCSGIYSYLILDIY